MPRNPALLTPILDDKDDFTICSHITRLELRDEKGNGPVQYYQEQVAFTAAAAPFSDGNAGVGDVYKK